MNPFPPFYPANIYPANPPQAKDASNIHELAFNNKPKQHSPLD